MGELRIQNHGEIPSLHQKARHLSPMILYFGLNGEYLKKKKSYSSIYYLSISNYATRLSLTQSYPNFTLILVLVVEELIQARSE